MKNPSRRFSLLASIFLVLGSIPCVLAASFSATGALSIVRSRPTATLLSDGKVLVAGGYSSSNIIVSSAELYDPSSGAWVATGSMGIARQWHTATLLPNGKVLVVGGYNYADGNLSSAELYDPVSRTWTQTGSMAFRRREHTAMLLSSGKVLVVGGYMAVGGGGSFSTAELYDPASGTWTQTGAQHADYPRRTATLLPNGKVLVVGGVDGFANLSGAELFDPVTGTWAVTGSLVFARSNHTATLLSNGKVLVAGGYNGNDLANAELYDPASGTWTTTGSMIAARGLFSATLLTNGMVLVAGGTGLSSAELYDPFTGSWMPTGALSATRDWHTATLLGNGKVLVAGGSGRSSADLYDANFTIGVKDGIISLADNSSTPVSFGYIPVGNPVVKTFTITNGGSINLTLGAISKDGMNADDFTVTQPGKNTLAAEASTTFNVTFTPNTAGLKSAVIHIASSATGALNPFDIALTGTGLSSTTDTDSDGMNDAAEFNLSPLGFDWQVTQVALVNALSAGANGAGLYTTSQVQALHTGTPLIARDPLTGKFKLTMSWQKSTNLINYSDFPVPTGSSVSVNPSGDIEFEFGMPDAAAFFRMEVR